MLEVRPKETAFMLSCDRVRLYADIYRPDAEGEFPVLLMRQPYGRAIAHPKFCCLWFLDPKVVEMRHVTSLLLACRHFLAHEVQANYLYQDQKE